MLEILPIMAMTLAPAFGGFWLFDWMRGRRRNRRGRCSECNAGWTEAITYRYVVQGRLICSRCGTSLRRDTGVVLVVLSVLVVAETMAGIWTIAANGLWFELEGALLVGLPVGIGVGVVSAMALMKRANRKLLALGPFDRDRIEAGDVELEERKADRALAR